MWRDLPIFSKQRVRLPTGWRQPSSTVSASGFDVADSREFLPGDPFRALNRKRFVSSGDEIIYEKRPERGGLYLFLLDVSASQYTGKDRSKIAACLEFLYHFGQACLWRGNFLQIITFSDAIEVETPIIATLSSFEDWIVTLKSSDPHNRLTRMDDALERAYRIATRAEFPADLVCLISDLLLPESLSFMENIGDLQEVTDFIMIGMEDVHEKAFSFFSGPFHYRDAESDQQIVGSLTSETKCLNDLVHQGVDTCILQSDQTNDQWYEELEEFFLIRSNR